jgi:hypothetical protein
VPAGGVVGAGFVHRTSRALDPHLHTHLVVANVAQGLDGLWSSVDTRRLFLHRRAVEAVYDSSLRHQMSERAGVSWERAPSGHWDIAGVDPVLERLFSQRAASIDEHFFRNAGGHRSAGRRRVAFHADRPSKDRRRTVEGLRTDWRRRAADLGLDPAELVDVVGRAPRGQVREPVDREVLTARLQLLAGARGTVAERDLVAAVADAASGGLAAADVEQVAGVLGRGTPGCPELAPRERATGGDEQRWTVRDLVRTVDGDGWAGVVADRRSRTAADDPFDRRRSTRNPGEEFGLGRTATTRPPGELMAPRAVEPQSWGRVR